MDTTWINVYYFLYNSFLIKNKKNCLLNTWQLSNSCKEKKNIYTKSGNLERVIFHPM